MGFSTVDAVIVVVYMAASVAFGAWIGRDQKSTTDYFLGGRRLPWIAVTFSIVATETSVLTFIGIPGIAYLGNMTFLQLALGYIVGRTLVAFVLLPAYYRGDLQTAYQFLGARFGQRMRNTASITFMGTRVLADGVRLFATAIPLAYILKGSGMFTGYSDATFFAVAIVVIGSLTVVYTWFGGIRSVIWMDVIQMTIYIGGAIVAGVIILRALPGGTSGLLDWGSTRDKFTWFDSGLGLHFDEFLKKPLTFFTALIGGAVFSLASHGTDQLIIQRVLTCGSRRAGQLAMTASGIAVFLQFLLFLVIGVALHAYYKGASLDALGGIRSDGIFPKFILEQLPTGVSGLIVAALFAAAMSTVSSSLSSLSSAAVLDIYVPLAGKEKSDADLLRLSRWVTLGWGVVLMGAALAFTRLDPKSDVVNTALGIASYTYGGLLGVFLLGLFRKPSQRDAILGFFAALIVNTILISTVKIAWPLYTVVGSLTAIGVGHLSYWMSGR